MVTHGPALQQAVKANARTYVFSLAEKDEILRLIDETSLTQAGAMRKFNIHSKAFYSDWKKAQGKRIADVRLSGLEGVAKKRKLKTGNVGKVTKYIEEGEFIRAYIKKYQGMPAARAILSVGDNDARPDNQTARPHVVCRTHFRPFSFLLHPWTSTIADIGTLRFEAFRPGP
jgi:predicted DNA-binding protein (UPF0251 family)